MKRRKRFVGLMAAAVLAAVVCLPNPLRSFGLRQMGLWLNVGTTAPEPVDYVLSLAGGEEIRPFVGAALVNVERAPQALVVNTESAPDVQDGIKRPTQEILRDVYLVRGVPHEKLVFLDGSCASTFDEALAVRRFLESQAKPVSVASGALRLAVVTHDFHTRRARWIFARVLSDLPVEIVMVSAPSENFRLSSWWTTKSGWITVAPEYLKLAFYHLRYGNGIWWLMAAAAIFGSIFWCRRRVRRRTQNAPSEH